MKNYKEVKFIKEIEFYLKESIIDNGLAKNLENKHLNIRLFENDYTIQFIKIIDALTGEILFESEGGSNSYGKEVKIFNMDKFEYVFYQWDEAHEEEIRKAEMAKKVEKDRLEAIKQFGNNDLKIVIGEHKILIAKGFITMFGITETHPNFELIVNYVKNNPNCKLIKDKDLWYDVYEGDIKIGITFESVKAYIKDTEIFHLSKGDNDFNYRETIEAIHNYCEPLNDGIYK